MNIREELFKMQDLKYRDFHSKLMPTVLKDKIIGVRVPVLRKFAKELAKSKEYGDFLECLPHKYYEEDNLHAFILESISDFDELILKADKFLPYIDNWATCDMFRPKAFAKNKDRLLPEIYEWLKSDKTYTVRYAIGLLLSFYLDEDFSEIYLKKVSEIKSEEYYINMMIAWYFATALSKQYEAAVQFLEKKTLGVWVHNKTIQKAIESNRIDAKTKEYLKSLKI